MERETGEEGGAPVDGLPLELLSLVLCRLVEERDLLAATCVCRRWHSLSAHLWSSWCRSRGCSRPATDRPAAGWGGHAHAVASVEKVYGSLAERDIHGNSVLHQELYALQYLRKEEGLGRRHSGRLREASARAVALVEHGIHPWAINDLGRTVLHLAASTGVGSVISALHEVGQLETILEARCARGRSPLATAARAGQLHIMQRLHEMGATIHNRENNGRTALHSAAKYGHLETLEWLIAHGAEVDAKSNCSRTPFLMAARYGHLEIVKTLRRHGAHCFGHERKAGNTPLLYAAVEGHIEIVRWLLEIGADPNECNRVRCSPLQWAIRMGHEDIVHCLVEHGADVNIPNRHLRRPLHIAARSSHVAIIQLLIDNGAGIDCVDYNGATPLHCAAEFGHLRAAKCLVKNGANRYAEDLQGRTAVVIAAAAGRSTLVNWLLTDAPAVAARHMNKRIARAAALEAEAEAEAAARAAAEEHPGEEGQDPSCRTSPDIVTSVSVSQKVVPPTTAVKGASLSTPSVLALPGTDLTCPADCV